MTRRRKSSPLLSKKTRVNPFHPCKSVSICVPFFCSYNMTYRRKSSLLLSKEIGVNPFHPCKSVFHSSLPHPLAGISLIHIFLYRTGCPWSCSDRGIFSGCAEYGGRW
jgi:hypothetical protein